MCLSTEVAREGGCTFPEDFNFPENFGDADEYALVIPDPELLLEFLRVFMLMNKAS